MWRKIHISKIPLLPLYRASGSKTNSLSAYGRTEQEAIERLKSGGATTDRPSVIRSTSLLLLSCSDVHFPCRQVSTASVAMKS